MRARKSETNLLPLALRRALGLYILGTLHAVLLRDGDVVYIYAILSLFIILLRNSNDKKLVTAIIIVSLAPTIYYLLLKWLGLKPVPWVEVNVKGTGPFAKNISHLVQHWYPHFIELNSGVLFLLLVGMYAARKGWLEKLQSNPRHLNIMIIAGIPLALGWFLIPWQQLVPTTENYYSKVFIYFFRGLFRIPFDWGIDIVYIGIFLHLIRLGKPKILLQSLGNMGKMALTNYLLPDIFFIPLFFIIFNLWAKVPAIQQVMMATAFTIFLGWFSTWWLKRYNFGPFEWLLRSFTYWKWQPMKKKELIQHKGTTLSISMKEEA